MHCFKLNDIFFKLKNRKEIKSSFETRTQSFSRNRIQVHLSEPIQVLHGNPNHHLEMAQTRRQIRFKPKTHPFTSGGVCEAFHIVRPSWFNMSYSSVCIVKFKPRNFNTRARNSSSPGSSRSCHHICGFQGQGQEPQLKVKTWFELWVGSSFRV